jgi:hypothetical protein
MRQSATTTMSTTSLLPFARLVLVISAVVQLVFGLVGLFFTNQLWNTIFWTAPLPAWPVEAMRAEAMRFASLTYLATAIAALYALYQGSWDGARVSFAFSFPSIVFSVLAALVTAIQPGVPLIMGLYVLLSILSLPAVAYAWYQQSRQAQQARTAEHVA